MSDAWDAGAIARSLRTRQRTLWRGVEAQHLVATARLAESAADQHLLELMLEASKPPRAGGTRAPHYLLATPFRYRAPIASRFRRAHEAGAWYGAEDVRTACAEVGYWRWRFLVDSDGLVGQTVVTTHSLFRAQVRGRCLDLTGAPWNAFERQWRDPRDYSACQALAVEARARGAAWIRYASARATGNCGVVFELASLSLARAAPMQTWVCRVTRARVRLQRNGAAAAAEAHEFDAAGWA